MKKYSPLCAIAFFISTGLSGQNGPAPASIREKLDEYMSALSNAHKFNGAVLLAQKGTILLKKGYGWKDAATNHLNDENGIFQIGSLTKPFTAELILKLQEQGQLSLQDRLSRFFPDYPKGGTITIENLLTHTSGIPGYDVDETDTIAWSPMRKEVIVDLFKNKPLEFKPGSTFKYSNAGYFLLGMIAEQITGKKYEEMVRETIFGPVGMTHSGFDFIHLHDPLKVTGYALLNADIQVPVHLIDSTVSYAAGAMYSNTDDLYKWARSVAKKQILSEASWKKAFTPYKANYGYGWFIDSLNGRSYIGHSGGIMGFTSYLVYFPSEDLTIILLNNFLNEKDPYPLPVQDLSAIVFNKPYTLFSQKKQVDPASSALDRYLGTYSLSTNAKRTMIITKADKSLEVSLNGKVISVLVFLTNTQFQFKNIPNAGGKFILENGNVIKMVISQNGIYEWKKIK